MHALCLSGSRFDDNKATAFEPQKEESLILRTHSASVLPPTNFVNEKKVVERISNVIYSSQNWFCLRFRAWGLRNNLVVI